MSSYEIALAGLNRQSQAVASYAQQIVMGGCDKCQKDETAQNDSALPVDSVDIGSNSDPTNAILGTMVAKTAFQADLAIIHTQDQMDRELLNILV